MFRMRVDGFVAEPPEHFASVHERLNLVLMMRAETVIKAGFS